MILTCLNIFNDTVVVGFNSGIIKFYSLKSEVETRSLINKDIEKLTKKSALCVDLTENHEFLIVGHQNGMVTFWNTLKCKCIKIISEVHQAPIISIRILSHNIKEKVFLAISTDSEGEVNRIWIKDGLVRTKIEISQIFPKENGFFKIEMLKFNEKYQRLYPNLCKNMIFALANDEKMIICVCDPDIRNVFTYERPTFTSKNDYIPDISFGFGYGPLLYSDNDSKSVKSSEYSHHELLLFLAISMEKFVFFFWLNFIDDIEFKYLGYYHSQVDIIKIGFISNSILFILDSNRNVKLISTSSIKVGHFNIQEKDEYDFSSCELHERLELDKDIFFQGYLFDKTDYTKVKFNYDNAIFCRAKSLFFLARRDFFHVQLFDWKECLRTLTSNKEWVKAISFAVDIYKGRISAISLPDVPLNEEERRELVSNEIKTIITNFASETIKATLDDPVKLESTSREKVSFCLGICVEVCSEIESLSYLFQDILPLLSSNDLIDDFLKCLEPHILCDKFFYENLDHSTISSIISYYVRRKDYNLLSKILVHLEIKSIDNDEIRQLCIENNLITPLIYICTNGAENNYYFPLVKLYELFKNADDIKRIPSMIEDNQNLLNSKHYIALKILWFLDLCFKGQKYRMNDQITGIKLREVVIVGVSFLLSEFIFPQILIIDSQSLFQVLLNLLSSKIIQIFLQSDQTTIDSILKGKDLFLLRNTLFDTWSIIKHVTSYVEWNEFLNNQEIKYHYSIFILKSSVLENQGVISKSLILKSIIHLCNSLPDFAKDINQIDYFKNSTMIIFDVLEKRFDIDMKDCYSLLSSLEYSPFTDVKLILLRRTNNFKRFIATLLSNDPFYFKKKEDLFEFIEETLEDLKRNDMPAHVNLKKECLERLNELAKIDIEKTSNLVDKYFQIEINSVVNKLGSTPKIQLIYLSSLIEKNKEKIESMMLNEIHHIEKELNMKFYNELMRLHIRLLCQFERDQVLPLLESRINIYPIKECLKICIEFKVHDATIFLYQYIGEINDALNLLFSLFQSCFDERISNLLNEMIAEKEFNLKNQFSKIFHDLIDFCLKNSSKNEGNEVELWLQVLKKLHKMVETLRSNEYFEILFKDVETELITHFSDLMEQMCSFVPIRIIIDNVTTFYKDAEFKEFKKIIRKMLKSYNHQKNILICAKKLLSDSIGLGVFTLKNLNRQGVKYDMRKCDSCLKKLEKKTLQVFHCGHKYHLDCLEELVEIDCLICSKNELNFKQNQMKRRNSMIERSDTKRKSVEEELKMIFNLEKQEKSWQRRILCERLRLQEKKTNEILSSVYSV